MLPLSLLDGTGSAILSNRSYSVQVMNAQTFQINNAACGVALPYALAPNEHFFVTVRITWFAENKINSGEQSVALSTVIP